MYLRKLIISFLLLTALIGTAQTPDSQHRFPDDTDWEPRFKTLPRDFIHDQWKLWKAPFKARGDDARWIAPLGILTGSLIASDKYAPAELAGSASSQKQFNSLSNYGLVGIAGAAFAAYSFGRLKDNDYLRSTGFRAATAMLHTVVVTEVIKTVTRRERPFEGDNLGHFWVGGTSFPSEHASLAWSAATVFATRYPGPLTKILFYGGASAISFSRVIANKHFPSDVFVGSTLGFLIGREIAKRDYSPGADQKYGTFVKTDREVDGGTRASEYVPIDNWVYGAFDRLAARGFAPEAFMGLRPWTRQECMRLVDKLGELDPEEQDPAVSSIIKALRIEFGDNPYSEAGVDDIYVRGMQISGTPLTQGYYFGSTIVNDYGRPFQEGFNSVAGIRAHARSGAISAYISAEYQHSPSSPALPLSARQAMTINYVNNSPLMPAIPFSQIDRVRLLDAYVSVQFSNLQFSFGQQSLWWGPGQMGPLLASNNASPLLMARLDLTKPVKLPSIFGFLGPLRTQSFFARAAGQHIVHDSQGFVGDFNTTLSDQPYIFGFKLSFKPTPNLEFGVSRTSMFGGPGFPVTPNRLRYVLFSTTTQNTDQTDPGDRRSGFDFSYRLPGLRKWLVLYNDSMAEDEISPIAYPRRSAMNPGLYMPAVPFIPKLELRAEAAYTDLPGLVQNGFYYFNLRYLEGYTNNGQLIGNWVGREGKALQFSSTYSITPVRTITVGARRLSANAESGRGGTQQDVWMRSRWRLSDNWDADGAVAFESWNFPALSSTGQKDVTVSLQLTYHPRMLRISDGNQK